MNLNGSVLRSDLAQVSVALLFYALLAFHAPASRAQQMTAVSGQDAPTKSERLELVENLSESLANDLVDLSLAVRDRNLKRIADFFSPQINSTPFPSKPQGVDKQLRWIEIRRWRRGRDSMQATTASFAKLNIGLTQPARREEFIGDLSSFLRHFGEIEDVRFALKEALFDEDAQAVVEVGAPTAVEGATGWARVAFNLIGRNRMGQREWASGTFRARVRKAKANWMIESFELEQDFRSMVAQEELFSEITGPAGVAAKIPAFGARGNDNMMHGVAVTDFNGDGLVDMFITAPYRNYLYLNDGKGHFRDVSEAAGVKVLATGVAPITLDYDNDGAPDIFISNDGGQILLQNRLKKDGRLFFRDVSNESGVGASRAIGFSAVAGDINSDGLPDIYVASYNHYGQVTPDSWFRARNGTPNLLFINQGDGTFKEEAQRWGIDDSRWTYTVGLADVNGDGKLDVYVGNDFGEKALFINKGDHFVDEASERGVLDPGNAMGIAFGDYNNDGLLDIHCTNMSSIAGARMLARLFPNQKATENVLLKLDAGNSLFEGDGTGHFHDVSSEVGGLLAGWAWCGGFIDFDNDGWEDLFTTNGYISGRSMKDTASLYWRLIITTTASASRSDLDRQMSEQGFSFAGYERDSLFMNVRADGSSSHTRKFINISGVSGVDSITDGRGAAFADFDNDGDYDLFMTTLQGESHLLFRNNIGQKNHYLRIALEGNTTKGGCGLDAFGSVVRVKTSQGTLTKIKAGGSGFISQHDPRLIFGLGQDVRAQAVEVTWANGKVEHFRGDFTANSSALLREGAGRAEKLKNGQAKFYHPSKEQLP